MFEAVEFVQFPSTTDSITMMRPQLDLEKALAKGDRRFLSVMSYAIMAPAIARDAPCLRTAGLKVVVGTSDNIRSEEFGVWQSSVIRYASEYNRLLAAHFRVGSPDSCPEWEPGHSTNAP
jgi:hypothetical protein